MCLRDYAIEFEHAVEQVGNIYGVLRHGTKNNLYFLILNSLEILSGHYSDKKEDDKVRELELFSKSFELKKDVMFGDAFYKINLNRQQKLRMPEQRAEEEEVEKLRLKTIETIKEISDEYTFCGPQEFVKLRDSLCSRLTLFNARRGGEPARLKISNFKDALAKRWVHHEDLDNLMDNERDLFKDMLIMYEPGKGNHLVPCLIPQDCVKGLHILCDPEVRARVKVPELNDYLFPNKGSMGHVNGWNTTNKMCLDAGVSNPSLLTASKQRHRISTMYAAMDVPESERAFFYKHMGHPKDVNAGTYQYPLAVMEVTKVGIHLKDIDQGMFSAFIESTCKCNLTFPLYVTISVACISYTRYAKYFRI